MTRLTTEERSFFKLVRQAVLANPFSANRAALDSAIAGRKGKAPQPDDVDNAVQAVRDRLETLEKRQRANRRLYSEPDRILLESTFLYDVFHRFIPQFDKLIADQVEAGDQNLKVSFASQVLALLRQRGFSQKNARRYFELCFQLRRAFFFIQKNLVGCSPCMRKLRERLWNNVFTHNLDWYDRYLWNRMEDFSTLILGPTGAGKGTAAVAIGRSGYIPFDVKSGTFIESFTRSFTALNLSQYSPALIESELFGHKKGAFTGAVEDYKGSFDRCSPHGAVFLDEIGEVDQTLQIKLLQVLQERTFTPVGSHRTHRFSGRVIAATNRDLEEIRGEGILRNDFFYRLCSDVIVVPSLAKRIREDPRELDDLLAHTVTRILGNPSPELTNLLKKSIQRQPGNAYAWPGNVRELEQCVRRILLNESYDSDPARVMDFADWLAKGVKQGRFDMQGLISGYCCCLYERWGTYEAVARKTKVDSRTVKRYIQEGRERFKGESFRNA